MSMAMSGPCVKDKISMNFYTSKHLKKIIIQSKLDVLQIGQISLQNGFGHYQDVQLRTQKRCL